MLSVEIIKRSFVNMRNNLDVAWKVSGQWWMILTIMTLPLAVQLDVSDRLLGGDITTSYAASLGPAALLWLIFYVAFVVIGFGETAIGWHRFLINGERPERFVFLEKGWRWGQYFWAGMLLTLITLVVMIVPLVIYSLTPNAFGEDSLGFSALGYNLMIQIGTLLPLTYLGLSLPAIALDKEDSGTKRISFSQSWQLTKNYRKELFMIVLTVSVVYALITSACEQVFGDGMIYGINPTHFVGYLVGSAVTWIMMLFGIGLISELYKEIVPEDWRAPSAR